MAPTRMRQEPIPKGNVGPRVVTRRVVSLLTAVADTRPFTPTRIESGRFEMKQTHSFRFVNDHLNHRLIQLLKKRAPGKFIIDADGVVHYLHDHEDLIGNDLISAVRAGEFSSWQVLSCPKRWVDSYRCYMTEHKVPFREELRDDTLRFLIPRSFRPHNWKLQEPPGRQDFDDTRDVGRLRRRRAVGG